MPNIEHVIVLLMENRSFDHLLGFLDHPDPRYPCLPKDHKVGGVQVSSTATYEIGSPDHSHQGVLQQLYGTGEFDKAWRPPRPFRTTNRNQGFVRNYLHRAGTTTRPGASCARSTRR